jgi:hypothetical protein
MLDLYKKQEKIRTAQMFRISVQEGKRSKDATSNTDRKSQTKDGQLFSFADLMELILHYLGPLNIAR